MTEHFKPAVQCIHLNNKSVPIDALLGKNNSKTRTVVDIITINEIHAKDCKIEIILNKTGRTRLAIVII